MGTVLKTMIGARFPWSIFATLTCDPLDVSTLPVTSSGRHAARSVPNQTACKGQWTLLFWDALLARFDGCKPRSTPCSAPPVCLMWEPSMHVTRIYGLLAAEHGPGSSTDHGSPLIELFSDAGRCPCGGGGVPAVVGTSRVCSPTN